MHRGRGLGRGWQVVAGLTLAATVALTAIRCSGGGDVELAIDVVTDLRPGLDFTSVRTTVRARMSGDVIAETSLPVTTDDEFLPDASRVAEHDDIDERDLEVQVALVDAMGATVLDRRVHVRLQGSRILQVTMTSSCVGVTCPGDGDAETATECLAGRCVPPSCESFDDSSCGEAECATMSDCEASSSCARALCSEGACVNATDDSACPVDEYCHPSRGCTRRPTTDPVDGGMPDADAAMDSGMESGMESGMPDADATMDGPWGEGPLGDSAVDAGCSPGSCADPAWRWDRTAGDESSDYGYAVAVDDAGNVVMTGRFVGTVDFGGGGRTSEGDSDVFVASYGPDGSWRWDRTFGGASADWGFGVAVDGAGNVVVTGKFRDTVDFGGGERTSAGSDDGFVASYGPDGTWNWDRTFGDASETGAYDVAVNDAGNVAVTGRFAGTVDFGGGERTSAGGKDLFIASYDSDGSWRWDRTVGGVSTDWGFGVATDTADNVVVTGQFNATVDFGGGARTSEGMGDAFVASYESDGTWRWDRTFGGSATDHGTNVTVDGAGNAVVVGQYQGTADLGDGTRTSVGMQDVFVASYGPDGSWRWDRTFGDDFVDIGVDVAVDGDDNVVVSGHFQGTVGFGDDARTSAGMDDVFVASYGSDGTWRWDRAFGGTAVDVGHSVAVDGDGNVVVSGQFGDSVDFGGGARTSAGGHDAFVLQLGCACSD